MDYLLLWLEGPMQSWGCNSRFDARTTLPFPTRSGILGLLLCAQGAGGKQEIWLKQMSQFGQLIIAFSKKKFGLPNVQPILRDFQMFGSSYNEDDKWQKCLIPKTADGKSPVGGGGKIILKHYIQDMAFACILEVPKNESEKLLYSLKNPVWSLYLGRKNCPPSDIIGRGIFSTETEAIKHANDLAEKKELIEVFTVKDGADIDGDETLIINDVPIYFGTWKKCRDRQVTIYRKNY